MPDFTLTDTAVLMSTCNKYEPGEQLFKLQCLTGLNENSITKDTTTLSKSNLMNADPSNIPISSINTSTVLKLDLPKKIAMDYPTKFIPPGTRFIISFTSGDITKPVIVGSDF